MHDFESFLQQKTHPVETLLDDILSSRLNKGKMACPQPLLTAMRYGVLEGGKRLRPFLLLESAALFGANPQAALQLAASLEILHCYSLVHDDLPSMDDDDLRRGRPSLHKKFNEATAILTGDALLTLAFELIAELPQCGGKSSPSTTTALRLVGALARASGFCGMVGGQMLDLNTQNQSADEQTIRNMQAMKTGQLIRYACEAGAIAGRASEDEISRLAKFGTRLGLAFQIADDLLDLNANTLSLGKTAGKDAKAGKKTLPALRGQAWARHELKRLTEEAIGWLEPFGTHAEQLRRAALFIIHRNK